MSTNDKSKEIRLGEGSWDRIWVPDTFLRNEKRANFHEVTVNNRLLRLNKTGYLWYVIKYVSTSDAPWKVKLGYIIMRSKAQLKA